jgi:hypothetical protein
MENVCLMNTTIAKILEMIGNRNTLVAEVFFYFKENNITSILAYKLTRIQVDLKKYIAKNCLKSNTEDSTGYIEMLKNKTFGGSTF